MGRFHIGSLKVSRETSTHTCVVTHQVTPVVFLVSHIKILHVLCCPSLFCPHSPCCPQLWSRSHQIRMGAVQLSSENTMDTLGFLHSTESKRGTFGQLSAAILEVICCYRTKQSNVHILFLFRFFPPQYSTMQWEF